MSNRSDCGTRSICSIECNTDSEYFWRFVQGNNVTYMCHTFDYLVAWDELYFMCREAIKLFSIGSNHHTIRSIRFDGLISHVCVIVCFIFKIVYVMSDVEMQTSILQVFIVNVYLLMSCSIWKRDFCHMKHYMAE